MAYLHLGRNVATRQAPPPSSSQSEKSASVAENSMVTALGSAEPKPKPKVKLVLLKPPKVIFESDLPNVKERGSREQGAGSRERAEQSNIQQ